MASIDSDFSRFEAAISRDRLPDRLPIAEVEVDFEIMEAYLGKPITDLATYVNFWQQAGYDYALLSVRGQWLSDSFQIKIPEVVSHPDDVHTASTFASLLDNEEAFEAYPWIELKDVFFRDVDLIEQYLPDGMKLVVSIGPIFSGIWRCMGLEGFSFACIENPELVRAVTDKTGGLLVSIIENLVQRDYVGAIWFGDDIAYTESLMVSPELLREYIFPYYRQIGQAVRGSGKLFLYHSDGDLTQVFDELLSFGIQAIHPNEPTSVDIVEVKQRWGNQVALVGNLDVDLLARGTAQQVSDATRHLIDHVAPGGGYALGSGNSITSYVPLENYKAMLDTVRRYGAY